MSVAGCAIHLKGVEVKPKASETIAPTPTALQETRLVALVQLGRGYANSVSRSTDGKFAAFVQDGLLKWFDAHSQKKLGEVSVQGADDPWFQISFSPDDQLAVVPNYFGAQIVDLEQKKVVGMIGGGNGPSSGFRFSKDSQYLAYLIHDRTTGGPYESIDLWSRQNPERSYFNDGAYFSTLLEGRYHIMSPPAISPDGRLVAAGHSDKRVYVWDLRTGKTRFRLQGHAAVVTCVDFSPDGSLLASGSMDGTIRLWNPKTGGLLRVITGFPDAVDFLEFTEDGKALHVWITDGPEQLVELQSGQITAFTPPLSAPDPLVVQQYEQGYASRSSNLFSSVLFSPDGKILAMGGKTILLWDVGSQGLQHVLETNTAGTRGMVFSPTGANLAVATDDQVLAWNVLTGAKVFSESSDFLSGASVFFGVGDTELGPARGSGAGAEQGLAFSPDGTKLAFGNSHAIDIWNVQRSAKIMDLENPAGLYATQLSWSVDGTRLYAVLNRNRTAQIWDTADGRLIKQVNLPHEDPNAFSAIALNGPLFARNNVESGDTGVIELWNLESESVIKLSVPSSQNEPLRFSADGKLLATIRESRLYVWSVITGRLVHESKLDVSSGGLALSGDGKMIAVWDNSQGKALLFDSGAISRLANQGGGVPPPTETTPAASAGTTPTATPGPTLTIPTPAATDARVIEATNAKKVQEGARFGEGTIGEASWSSDGKSVLLAGSLEAAEYSVSSTAGVSEKAHWKFAGWTTNIVELPDGRKLAAGVDGGKVYVRDLASGDSLADVPGGGEPVVSPDGSLLAFTNPDGYLELWNIAGSKPVATLADAYFHSARPIFSADSKWLAAIQSWQSRLLYSDSIRIWDARTGAIINALGGPDNDITDFVFSADGKFAVGAAGGSAWLWSTEPGQPPAPINLYEVKIDGNLNLYPQTVTAVALSGDDQVVAVGTSEDFIRLYDRRTRRPVRTIQGSSSPSRQLRFSPDGKTLLSVDEDGTLSTWDTASGRRLVTLENYNGAINGLIFRQGGNLAAWEDGIALNIQPGNEELVARTSIPSGKILAISPSGDLLAVYEPFRVSLRDARTGALVRTLDGEAEDPIVVDYQFEGLVLRGFFGAAFSPDGERLATAGTGGIWYYDIKSNRLLRRLEGTNARRVVFNPDGTSLLSSLYEQVQFVSVFDLASGESLFSLDSGSYDMAVDYPQFAFSPDGHWIAAVKTNWDSNDELLVFDAITGKEVRRLKFAKDIRPMSVAVNPSGGLVAVGQADGEIVLVSMDSMEIVEALSGHRGSVTQLLFSPDGQYLISAGEDGTIRTWGVR